MIRQSSAMRKACAEVVNLGWVYFRMIDLECRGARAGLRCERRPGVLVIRAQAKGLPRSMARPHS
jgi:hypothetical protein